MRSNLMSMLLVGMLLANAGCMSMLGGGKVADMSRGKLVADKDADSIPVKMASEAATIDGKLDDAMWADAIAMTDFVYGRSGKPEVKTRVLVTYDKQNLYIAVINAEPNTSKLKAAAIGRDGKIWSDDSVEIYVDASNKKGKNYYGFFVNSKNAVYDRTLSSKWSGEWTSATTVTPGKSWTTELAIPFKIMDITPKQGHKLGIMVARNRNVDLPKAQGFFLVPCAKEAKNTGAYPVLELK